jgi:phospholipid/cholesterol/gamma-HCH transport system substrate-binding protein
MASRAQKIRLSVFAVVSAVLLVTVLAVFAGVRFWEKRAGYRVDFEGTVLGLEIGAPVLVNGMRVGAVKSIELSPANIRSVRVGIEVDAAAPVRRDTRAFLVFQGITGLKIIDLRDGTSAAAPLAPGSAIPPGAGSLDRLEAKADQMVDKSARLLDNLIEVTDPKKFAGVEQILAQAKVSAESLARTSQELDALVRENRVVVRESLGAVGHAAQSLSDLLDDQLAPLAGEAGVLVGDVRSAVRANQIEVRQALGDLRQASRTFKELARELRQQPSRLLFSKAPEDRVLP